MLEIENHYLANNIVISITYQNTQSMLELVGKSIFAQSQSIFPQDPY